MAAWKQAARAEVARREQRGRRHSVSKPASELLRESRGYATPTNATGTSHFDAMTMAGRTPRRPPRRPHEQVHPYADLLIMRRLLGYNRGDAH